MPTDYLDDPFTPVDVKDTIAQVPLPGIPTVAEAQSNDPLKGLTEADRAEVVRLRSEHPDYAANKGKWEFLLKSYEGGPNYADNTTLFRHQRENEESYNDRLTRAAYVNYTAPLVDFVPDYIFAKPPERNSDSLMQQAFSQFVEDVDRAGTHINDFMREVAIDTRLFGYCWIGVDKPTIPPSESTDTLSVQRAKELGVDMPYWFIVRPLEVLDWNTNRHGQYSYFKRREYVTEQDGFVQTRAEQYTEWTPTEIKISQIDITDPQKVRLLTPKQIPNPQKRIPFIPSFNRRSKVNKDMGTSAVQDIAYQNRSVFNYGSLLDEFLARQCFNQLAIEADTSLPTVDRQEGNLGTSNVIEVPPNAKMPVYVSPPVDPAAFIQSERANAIQEMFRQAAQDAMSELFGADARSGDAARQSFGRTAPVIARLADSLQQVEVEALKLWATMAGRAWGTGKVSYRDDYGSESVSDMLLSLTAIFRQIQVLSPTWVKAEWKRVVRTFDSRIDPKTMATIMQEIDGVSDEVIVDLIKSKPKNANTTPGMPATAQMLQGRTQQALGTDTRRSIQSGDQSATKETIPDANKRTNRPRATVR